MRLTLTYPRLGDYHGVKMTLICGDVFVEADELHDAEFCGYVGLTDTHARVAADTTGRRFALLPDDATALRVVVRAHLGVPES